MMPAATWTFPAPVIVEEVRYTSLTLRAPTGEDVCQAVALAGAAAGIDMLLCLIAAASVERVPRDAITQLPWRLIAEMLIQITAPQHWSRLARDARAVSRLVSDPGMKAAIEMLANGYDAMGIGGAAVARDWMREREREQKWTLH